MFIYAGIVARLVISFSWSFTLHLKSFVVLDFVYYEYDYVRQGVMILA
jgi:hypothetical protein